MTEANETLRAIFVQRDWSEWLSIFTAILSLWGALISAALLFWRHLRSRAENKAKRLAELRNAFYTADRLLRSDIAKAERLSRRNVVEATAIHIVLCTEANDPRKAQASIARLRKQIAGGEGQQIADFYEKYVSMYDTETRSSSAVFGYFSTDKKSVFLGANLTGEKFKEWTAGFSSLQPILPAFARSSTSAQHNARFFDFICRKEPNFAWAWIARAGATLEQRQWHECELYATIGIALEPHAYKAYYLRARALEALGQGQDAIDDYRKSVELNGAFSQGYLSLGVCLGMLGRSEDAIAAASRAIQIDPAAYQAYHNRATSYLRLRQFEPAIADYTFVIEKTDDPLLRYRATNDLAATHMQRKTFNRAREVLTPIYENMDTIPESVVASALNLLAICASEEGDRAESVRLYIKALTFGSKRQTFSTIAINLVAELGKNWPGIQTELGPDIFTDLRAAVDAKWDDDDEAIATIHRFLWAMVATFDPLIDEIKEQDDFDASDLFILDLIVERVDLPETRRAEVSDLIVKARDQLFRDTEALEAYRALRGRFRDPSEGLTLIEEGSRETIL